MITSNSQVLNENKHIINAAANKSIFFDFLRILVDEDWHKTRGSSDNVIAVVGDAVLQ